MKEKPVEIQPETDRDLPSTPDPQTQAESSELSKLLNAAKELCETFERVVIDSGADSAHNMLVGVSMQRAIDRYELMQKAMLKFKFELLNSERHGACLRIQFNRSTDQFILSVRDATKFASRIKAITQRVATRVDRVNRERMAIKRKKRKRKTSRDQRKHNRGH